MIRAQDAISSYKDDRLITTTYTRNGFGEVTQEVSPDAGTTTYNRDLRGLVTASKKRGRFPLISLSRECFPFNRKKQETRTLPFVSSKSHLRMILNARLSL